MNYFLKLSKGRIKRGPWFGGLIFYGVVANICFWILKTLSESNDISETTYTVFMFVVIIIILVFFLSLSARRLHDMGKSGYIAYFLVVPLIQIGIFIYLFTHGQDIKNEYGDIPSENLDTIWKYS
jgi:uncharacterized membrane protein YhaH (DUF805 family)